MIIPSRTISISPTKRRSRTMGTVRKTLLNRHHKWLCQPCSDATGGSKTRPGGGGNHVSIFRVVQLKRLDNARIDLIRGEGGKQRQACGGLMCCLYVSHSVLHPAPADAHRLTVPGLNMLDRKSVVQ